MVSLKTISYSILLPDCCKFIFEWWVLVRAVAFWRLDTRWPQLNWNVSYWGQTHHGWHSQVCWVNRLGIQMIVLLLFCWRKTKSGGIFFNSQGPKYRYYPKARELMLMIKFSLCCKRLNTSLQDVILKQWSPRYTELRCCGQPTVA